ncbi:4a-hydroxytetrahydrobiopterin dehydratase [Streptomyces acidiscabies]|uniref:Putative pterin-4-alpha-carbinolamine dehydratase n=1 Tax=Streptomyces acidiscabies TaxID=42234 RepID=A0AAP6BC76_9ACTN|nr:4a-hydroxytetrahydrobiopterin dehydratase [Streptomyces acidiscabies]MBP5935847.1 4a-hydroxytetrahydrobiopterin dehydratase [Streptomyces sp. LBUM 1476]MBZ3916243.1 4a-hydroxytetrahydrobiopterin dehydratase [Streptomyces acidiscabies]MDX2962082.1 4a-hydroxytetrahydrobiopterin dehydratase [Streptomyces acidiscabies]MDX3017921.1 4a-hydroxytetrahydrobiopterin dehydratase [Streptomyces acidiscabies]MDX3791306.1 4a-hydroxytetrahydrobiopterin dehydratase [Streptomyces acidiscabies]
MPAEPLSREEVEEQLAGLPGWAVEGGALGCRYRFSSHFAATAFVVHVARVQDELNHHSDLTLGYDTVTLAVRTHDAGGALTALDFQLARRVRESAVAHEAR